MSVTQELSKLQKEYKFLQEKLDKLENENHILTTFVQHSKIAETKETRKIPHHPHDVNAELDKKITYFFRYLFVGSSAIGLLYPNILFVTYAAFIYLISP